MMQISFVILTFLLIWVDKHFSMDVSLPEAGQIPLGGHPCRSKPVHDLEQN